MAAMNPELVDRFFLVAAPVSVALVALPLLLGRRNRQKTPWPDSGGKRIVLGIAASMLISAAFGLLVARQGLQTFAAFSLAKRYALPATYLVFATLLVWPRKKKEVTGPKPLWWWFLLAILGLSSATSLIVPRQDQVIIDLAQGAALIAGTLIISALGFRGADAKNRGRLIGVLIAGAVASAVLGAGFGPFVALDVPAAFAALYLAITGTRRRLLLLLVTGGLAVVLWQQLRVEGASLAVISQVAVCAGILALTAFPRGLRPLLVALGSIAAVVYAVHANVWSLLSGNYGAFSDVTIAHRAYEARAVSELVGQSIVSRVVGLGPSATVDLNGSPDAGTLASSGRNLSAVDDVHLLSSYVLLKFGLLGLVWLGMFLWAVGRRAAMTVARSSTPYDIPLVMFLAAGVVDALPAATNLFVNPLPALILAVLSVGLGPRRPDTAPEAAVTSQTRRTPAATTLR